MPIKQSIIERMELNAEDVKHSHFEAFTMVLSKRKRPHRTVFPLYKVFIFSLFYSFPRLKIFAP